MASDELVSLLKKAYRDEIETVTNYMANAILLSTLHGEQVAAALREDIQEELGHAEELGYRLRYHGERPPGSMDIEAAQESLQPPADSTDVLSVIDAVIEAEQDAIETYEALIEAADEADDYVTEDLAVELLEDEQGHEAQFQSYRQQFE
jgi:bacterioferritin